MRRGRPIEIYVCKLEDIEDGKCKYADSVFCPLKIFCMYCVDKDKQK